MRHFAVSAFAAVLAIASVLPAQAQVISPQEARQHVGSFATVQGTVVQVSTSNGGTTFLNFGARFPDHVFYAVIFPSVAAQFPGMHGLEGQEVAITGAIDLYQGKPQIILNSPDQIERR